MDGYLIVTVHYSYKGQEINLRVLVEVKLINGRELVSII